jgi:hypothetical protein
VPAALVEPARPELSLVQLGDVAEQGDVDVAQRPTVRRQSGHRLQVPVVGDPLGLPGGRVHQVDVVDHGFGGAVPVADERDDSGIVASLRQGRPGVHGQGDADCCSHDT